MTIDQFVNLTSGEYLACLEFVYERLIKCEPIIIGLGLVKLKRLGWIFKPEKDASRFGERCYE